MVITACAAHAGAQFGYHPGGWGKPPVDEEGNPVYGDVFGQRVGEAESDDEVCVIFNRSGHKLRHAGEGN